MQHHSAGSKEKKKKKKEMESELSIVKEEGEHCVSSADPG